MKRFKCIDCFSGAGGLSLGLQQAGIDVAYSFDNDPVCIETQKINKAYFKHESETLSIEAALRKKLFLENLNIKRDELFLIAGGPPCQGFSIQRVGSDKDKRNNLVSAYVEFVLKLRPKYFLMENVPGIMGKRGKEILKECTDQLEQGGYRIHSSVLDAQDFGVPQRRKRLFVVGERNDGKPATFAFPSPTTADAKKRVTVRDIISHLPEPPEDGSDHPKFTHHRRDRLSPINKKRLEALRPGQGREYLPENLLAKCHFRDSSQIGHRNVYGRMEWNDVAPTITARFDSFTRGMFGHPAQTRTISLREGALLQTFPGDFIFAGNKVDIARQIGNAVPPKLAQEIGKSLIKAYVKEQKNSSISESRRKASKAS